MESIKKWLTENGEKTNKQYTGDSVKCVIKNKENEVLIMRRASNAAGEGGGEWDLPGGHIEKGEDPLMAVKREVKEETRLRLNDPTKIKTVTIERGDGEFKSKTTVFRSKPWGRDDVYIHASGSNKDPFFWQQFPRPEHTEYKWIKYKDELERLIMQGQLKEIVISELEERENPSNVATKK